jgi:hypothetical protein
LLTGKLNGSGTLLVQAERGGLTWLLAWNRGKYIEWQEVIAGSSLFNAMPCEDWQSQLDDQRRRQPGSGQLPGLRSAIDSPPQQLCAAVEGPSNTRTTGGIDRASGEGKIYPYEQIDANHYNALDPIPSATGAKTAVLSQDSSNLFLAVSPGEGKTGAKVLTFALE